MKQSDVIGKELNQNPVEIEIQKYIQESIYSQLNCNSKTSNEEADTANQTASLPIKEAVPTYQPFIIFDRNLFHQFSPKENLFNRRYFSFDELKELAKRNFENYLLDRRSEINKNGIKLYAGLEESVFHQRFFTNYNRLNLSPIILLFLFAHGSQTTDERIKSFVNQLPKFLMTIFMDYLKISLSPTSSATTMELKEIDPQTAVLIEHVEFNIARQQIEIEHPEYNVARQQMKDGLIIYSPQKTNQSQIIVETKYWITSNSNNQVSIRKVEGKIHFTHFVNKELYDLFIQSFPCKDPKNKLENLINTSMEMAEKQCQIIDFFKDNTKDEKEKKKKFNDLIAPPVGTAEEQKFLIEQKSKILDDNFVEELFHQCSAYARELTEIDLQACSHMTEGDTLILISNACPNLESLNISGTNIKMIEDKGEKTNFNHLKRLNAANCVRLRSISLGHCNIEELNLSRCFSFDFQKLPHWISLKKFSLNATSITDSELTSFLNTSPNLEILDLSLSLNITDEAISSAITTLAKLRLLLTKECPFIKHFQIENEADFFSAKLLNYLTPEEERNFRCYCTLYQGKTSFFNKNILSKIKINKEDLGFLKFLSYILIKQHTHDHFILRNVSLGQTGVKIFCHALQKNPKIRYVSLNNCKVSKEGVDYISQWMSDSQNKEQYIEFKIINDNSFVSTLPSLKTIEDITSHNATMALQQMMPFFAEGASTTDNPPEDMHHNQHESGCTIT